MIAEAHAQRLLATLVPLHAYATQQRGRDELTAYQFSHVCEIEAALNAAADLLEVLNPPDTPLMAATRRRLAFYTDPAPLTAAKLRAHYPDALPELHPPEPAHAAEVHRKAS